MKQIANYPDYKVDVDGTVISYKFGKTKVLKPQLVSQSKKKYLQVGLFNENNRRNKNGMKVPKMLYVHRLVWETFVGEIPNNLQVEHKDQNPHNCSLDNLELLTPKENIRSHFRNKTGNPVSRERRDEFIKDYLILKNYRLVAEKHKCSKATVSRVIKNKLYSPGKIFTNYSDIDDKFTKNDLRSSKFKKENGIKSAYEWRGKL